MNKQIQEIKGLFEQILGCEVVDSKHGYVIVTAEYESFMLVQDRRKLWSIKHPHKELDYVSFGRIGEAFQFAFIAAGGSPHDFPRDLQFLDLSDSHEDIVY